ncbi:MAG TPA: hypothetical protein VF677_15590 [Flavobacterium sp.]|jgi:hypothetical protein
MEGIATVYDNDFGMAFYWKKGNRVMRDKVQLVFKETGLHLNLEELCQFQTLIGQSYNENLGCAQCEMKYQCHKFLLKTPCPQIDFAVSMKELNAIKDLVEGTLFKINLDDYVFGVGRN